MDDEELETPTEGEDTPTHSIDVYEQLETVIELLTKKPITPSII